jgi:hypothetical protein
VYFKITRNNHQYGKCLYLRVYLNVMLYFVRKSCRKPDRFHQHWASLARRAERSPKGINFAAKSMVLERKHSLLYTVGEGTVRPEAVLGRVEQST